MFFIAFGCKDYKNIQGFLKYAKFANISKILKSHDRFLSFQQDRNANPAHSAAFFTLFWFAFKKPSYYFKKFCLTLLSEFQNKCQIFFSNFRGLLKLNYRKKVFYFALNFLPWEFFLITSLKAFSHQRRAKPFNT